MKRQVNLPVPAIKALRKLGQDISDARRRRRITVKLMTERADISKNTLARIEKGDPSVSMGRYASVLFVFGMAERFADLVDSVHDLTGRRLEEESLPKRVHLPKNGDEK
jgi:transcriptional regulator with XRE-family HTH domain